MYVFIKRFHPRDRIVAACFNIPVAAQNIIGYPGKLFKSFFVPVDNRLIGHVGAGGNHRPEPSEMKKQVMYRRIGQKKTEVFIPGRYFFGQAAGILFPEDDNRRPP